MPKMRLLLLVLWIDCMLFINPTLSVATDYNTICVESDTAPKGNAIFGTYVKKGKQNYGSGLEYYAMDISGSTFIYNIVFKTCPGTGYAAFNPDLCFCITQLTSWPTTGLQMESAVYSVGSQAYGGQYC